MYCWHCSLLVQGEEDKIGLKRKQMTVVMWTDLGNPEETVRDIKMMYKQEWTGKDYTAFYVLLKLY